MPVVVGPFCLALGTFPLGRGGSPPRLSTASEGHPLSTRVARCKEDNRKAVASFLKEEHLAVLQSALSLLPSLIRPSSHQTSKPFFGAVSVLLSHLGQSSLLRNRIDEARFAHFWSFLHLFMWTICSLYFGCSQVTQE